MILKLPSGYAVMADNQFLRGYCLLLACPLVGQLLDLDEFGRHQFLGDMTALGEAVKIATGAVRINFAIYGNVDPFLHAHVWPRFVDESEDRRTLPPLLFPEAVRSDPSNGWSAKAHGELQQQIASLLQASL